MPKMTSRRDLAVFARARPPRCDMQAPNRDLTAPPAPEALDRWNAGVRASESGDNVIQMYGVIGEDWWTGEGITSSTVTAALKRVGDRDVEVHINSPGGDMFEGISIFNILQAHPKKVTVKVMGLAASAASVIAMAGDEVLVGLGSFIMIHNCWVVSVGNRHDMREVADYLEPFDGALRDIYVSRTGQQPDDVTKWMDDERFLSASECVALGFADGMLDASDVSEDAEQTERAKAFNAVRKVEAALTRKGGMSRTEARALITSMKGGRRGDETPAATNESSGKPGAAADAKPGAGDSELIAGLLRLRQSLSTP